MKLNSILYIERTFTSIALLLVVLAVTGIQGVARWRPQPRQQRGPWQPEVQQQRGPWRPQVQQQRGQYGMSNYVDDFLSYLKPRRYLNRGGYQEEILGRNGPTQNEIEGDTARDFKSVTKELATFSQQMQRGVNCREIWIDTYTHDNNVPGNHGLQPEWIHQSDEIGQCPTEYVIRRLGPSKVPTEIMEARCKCRSSECGHGYQCIEVRKPAAIWVLRSSGDWVADLEYMGVGCACLARPAMEQNSLQNVTLES